MEIDRRFLRWGFFLIALGSVPLAVGFGWLDRAPVIDAERLWPIALIVMGLAVLIDRTRFGALGTALTATAFGLLIGGVLAVGVASIGCPSGATTPPSAASSSGTLTGPSEVSITFDCGSSAVGTTSGSTWSISDTATSDHRPVIDAGPTTLRIGPPPTDILEIGGNPSDWNVQLPTGPILDATFVVNASDARLGLAGARLSGLSLTANAGTVSLDLSQTAEIDHMSATVNAGDVRVTLPAAAVRPDQMNASITVNAGRLAVCLVQGTDLTINLSGVLSSNNFAAQGLVQDGGSWRNWQPAFNLDGNLVVLQVTANAGTIELNPSGGCE